MFGHLHAVASQGTISTVNCALAVKGVGWGSPHYIPTLLLQSVFGNWDRSLDASPLLSSRLSRIIPANSLANAHISFLTSYLDTGLWGIYFVSENLVNLDDLVHFTLHEWTRLSTAPIEAERRASLRRRFCSVLTEPRGLQRILDDRSSRADDASRRSRSRIRSRP